MTAKSTLVSPYAQDEPVDAPEGMTDAQHAAIRGLLREGQSMAVAVERGMATGAQEAEEAALQEAAAAVERDTPERRHVDRRAAWGEQAAGWFLGLPAPGTARYTGPTATEEQRREVSVALGRLREAREAVDLAGVEEAIADISVVITPPEPERDVFQPIRLEHVRERVRNGFEDRMDVRWLAQLADLGVACAQELREVVPDSPNVSALAAFFGGAAPPERAALAEVAAQARLRRQFGPTGAPIQDPEFVVARAAAESAERG